MSKEERQDRIQYGSQTQESMLTFSQEEVSEIMRKAFLPTLEQLNEFKDKGKTLGSKKIEEISSAQYRILMRAAKDVDFEMARAIERKLDALEEAIT